jgi:hypothetical protein
VTAPPAAAEAAIIGPTSELVRRIEIYEADAETRWDSGANDGRLIDGSVSIDYGRDERRSFDLTLDNDDFGLEHTPEAFWYDKIIKMFYGVKYVDTTPLTSYKVRTNLCLNPSFEANTTSWGGSSAGRTTSTIARDTTTFSVGIASLKITWPTGASSAAQYSATGLQPGKIYTISANIYVPSGSPDVFWGELFSGNVLYTAKDAWNRVSFTFVAYGSNHWFGPAVSNPTAGQLCWIDAVMIEQADRDLGYFDGSSPDFANRDYAWTGATSNSTSTETITVETPQAIETIWEVQVAECMIDQISEDNFPYVVKVSGRDYTKKCMLSKFSTATSFADGAAIESVIQTLATNAGITKFLLPLTGHTLGKLYTYERGVSRWEAMKDIANGFGYELYFDAQGYLVMREYLDPVTAPLAYSLATGPLVGNLVSYGKTVNDNRIYNKIVVTGESSDSEIIPVSAIAENTLPDSPTNIARLGERVYQYVSAFITTEAQAQDVADKFLKIHALEEFELSFSSIALPWLEVGEIIEFVDPRPSEGQPTRFLLSSLNLSLGLGPMTGNAKRVSVVG